MCTVALLYQQHDQWPLIIAANRDESLDRPAQPPMWWSVDDGIDFFAPKDEQAGGTWIGTNRSGLFVGITNRFMAGRDPLRSSRGTLTRQALTCASAQQALKKVLSWQAQDINPFHLLIADAHDAFVVWHDEAQLHHDVLVPGIHVITEQSFGAGDSTRERFVHAQCQRMLDEQLVNDDQLRAMLAVHHDRAFADVRVSLPQYNYGTRSSMLIYSDGQGRGVRVVSEDEVGFVPGRPGTIYHPLDV